MSDTVATSGETVLERVIRLLGKQTGTDNSNWSAATTIEQTGVDSFDFIELVFLIEDEFGIEIDYNHNVAEKRFVTIGDLSNAVTTLVARKAATPSPTGRSGAFA